jgi:hypothetical protein
MRVAGHKPDIPLPVGLYYTFAAEKRAEAAPGVGSETDCFIVWQLGDSNHIRDDAMATVERAFRKAVARSAEIAANTEIAVTAAIQEIIAPRPAPDQAAPPPAEAAKPVVLSDFRTPPAARAELAIDQSHVDAPPGTSRLCRRCAPKTPA